MIKRRFYKLEHADGGDNASDSSSDSELEEEEDAEEETSEESPANDVKVHNDSSSAIWEAKERPAKYTKRMDSLLLNEDDAETGNGIKNLADRQLSGSLGNKISEESDLIAAKDSFLADVGGYILKCKSVFKCRLSPRIVCLTEETLRAHLKSKRHARPEKLLNDGRLKVMLNSDGEEEHQETPAEMHPRIVICAEPIQRMKNRGRQRQRKRSKRKKFEDDSDKGKQRQEKKNPAKRRHKNEN